MATRAALGHTTRLGSMDLQRLGELPDYEVADDSPDVRGWSVTGIDEERIGRVEDLLVDRTRMTTRYLLVEVEGGVGASAQRRVLIPVSRARFDETYRGVRISVSRTQIHALPPDAGAVPATYEQMFPPPGVGVDAGRQREIGRTSGEQESPENVTRITRSAEELKIGRREVPAGEVRVSKHVETEHVRQPVTRIKEDVRVERRPVSGEREGRAEIRDDEIRVPIVEEEVVVEKRPSVKEELVISKERTPETKTVEADLRKEKVDVERRGRKDKRGSR